MNCQLNLQNKSTHAPRKKVRTKANVNYSITIAYWNSKNPQSGLIDEYQIKGLHNTLCSKMTQHQVNTLAEIFQGF